MDNDQKKPHEPTDDETPDVSHILNKSVTHEYSDVNIRAIIKFTVSLGVGIVVVGLIVWGVFKLLYKREMQEEVRLTPIERMTAEKPPPEPRLQLAPGHNVHPLEEMKAFREGQLEKLNSYGWVDKNTGIVRVPIDSAKLLLLRVGILSRPVDSATAIRESGGVLIPGASSAGRMIEWRDH
jgi:hypothetical protein